jgi:hypothetical protein
MIQKNVFTSGILLLIIMVLFSCNSRSQQVKEAKKLQSDIKKMMPGGMATTIGGYTMTAKINGRDWTASSIMPPDIAGVITGDNNGESISLPYYDKRNFLALKKRKLGKGHGGADMRLNDDVKFWSAKTGQMEITKADDQWAEGTFSFTAESLQSDKTTEVTNGFFRIALTKNK